MKPFKASYTDKTTGKKRKCSKWYLSFRDRRGLRRRLPISSDRRTTERYGVYIEKLVSSDILDAELQKWLKDIHPDIRNKLVSFGLVRSNKVTDNISKPLTEHLKDYCEDKIADNCDPVYIRNNRTAINKVLEGCDFQVWEDIDGSTAKVFLSKGRGGDGYSQGYYNAQLRAFKTFCKWLIEKKRVSGDDPMKEEKLIKVTEFRKKRRALTIAEQQKLLSVTETEPERHFASGHERALVYRLALETGLRSKEVRSLRVLSFNLEKLNVRIESCDAKGKRTDSLILMKETAQLLQEHFKGKSPKDRAFSLPHPTHMVKMIRDDLKASDIVYRDEADRDVDFHSLRHSFITNLALAGVHPSVAQKLARHSNILLTMRFYTHVLHDSEVNAIQALNNLTHTCQSGTLSGSPMDSNGLKNEDNGLKMRFSA